MSTAGDERHVPRDERRRRTEQAILDAARQMFAHDGFERTTIRGVARAAGVDPALVMQYFGSKDGLFAEAARWQDDARTVISAAREDVPRAAIADMFERFESEHADASVALVRSCLTNAEASRIMRDEVMCDRIAAVSAAIGGDDADLRAGLVGAILMGVTVARHVLAVQPVASASREDLERLLEPVLRALTEPPV